MGTVESIRQITPANIRQWHESRFSSKNMTWVVVGDISLNEVKDLLDRQLSAYSLGSAAKMKKHSVGPLEPLQYRLATRSQQASLVLGFRAPSFRSNEYYAFRVMNTILNGMGGRLFVELREKKSLAYSVYAAYDSASLAGVYQFYIGCAPQKVKTAQDGLITVLRSMAQKKVTPEELKRAKSYLIGLFQVGQQSNRAQLLAIGRQEMIGEGPEALDRYANSIERITAEDVQKMAKKYLMTSNYTTVLLAPEKG
jgi:zinc protease